MRTAERRLVPLVDAAGVVQLVGDGIPEQDLLDLAARLLAEP